MSTNISSQVKPTNTQPKKNTIVSLIVTHNSRLRCLLKNYSSIAEKTIDKNGLHRLMNCAI